MYLNMSVSLIIETVQAFLSSAEAPVGYSNNKQNNKKIVCAPRHRPSRAFISPSAQPPQDTKRPALRRLRRGSGC